MTDTAAFTPPAAVAFALSEAPPAAAPDAAPDHIGAAIRHLAEASREQTGGRWLENLTAAMAPAIREWDIARCYSWADWPERETHFPGTTQQDIGIDCVAVGRSDGRHIAIQCKARQLDADGRGDDIHKSELDKFIAAADNPVFAERWLVTNGGNRISGNARQVMAMSNGERPVKLVNIHHDLVAQQNAAPPPEPCPHCDPDASSGDAGDGDQPPRRTRQCMQDAAVAQSVRILKEHAQSESGGLTGAASPATIDTGLRRNDDGGSADDRRSNHPIGNATLG